MQRFFAPEIFQIYVRSNKTKKEIKCRAPCLLFTIFHPLFINKNHKLHYISNHWYIQNSGLIPLRNFVSLHRKYLYSFKKCQGHLTLFMDLSKSSKSKIKSSSLCYYMYMLFFTFVRINSPALYLSSWFVHCCFVCDDLSVIDNLLTKRSNTSFSSKQITRTDINLQ